MNGFVNNSKKSERLDTKSIKRNRKSAMDKLQGNQYTKVERSDSEQSTDDNADDYRQQNCEPPFHSPIK